MNVDTDKDIESPPRADRQAGQTGRRDFIRTLTAAGLAASVGPWILTSQPYAGGGKDAQNIAVEPLRSRVRQVVRRFVAGFTVGAVK